MMKAKPFLLIAVILFFPAVAAAQSLAITDLKPVESLERQPSISFTVVEPNHRFLPDGYKPPDTGFEIHGIFESALNRTLNGIVEYRWNEGGNPTLNIAGVPAGMKVRRNTVLLGVNYEL